MSAPYVRAVEAAGGVPIILRRERVAIDALIARIVDGLLLSGGPEMNPARYGDGYVHPSTYGIDPDRDQFEIDLSIRRCDKASRRSAFAAAFK